MVVKKITFPLILSIAFNFLTSCSSYKNGFIFPVDSSVVSMDSVNIEVLNKEKEKLNVETSQIVVDIQNRMEVRRSIHANELNNLFENLKRQYQIDLGYQTILNGSGSDSQKELARIGLVRSADFYNTEFQHKKLIRRIINRGDAAYEIPRKSLVNSQKFLWKRTNRKSLNEQQISLNSDQETKFKFTCEKEQDNLYNTAYKIVGFGSELFCRIITQIHGKSQPEINIEKLLPHLQKWDIVCQKSYKYLTDKFIPGYFGHSGIYLGDSIFAESIHTGVIYNTPEKFLVGNDFLVLRPKAITDNQKIRMETLLKAQIGKKYDFSFNIESPDRLICTELIYLVYDQIDWKTKRITGRYILTADNLVRTALINKDLELPFYMDEKEMVTYPTQDFVVELLKEN